MSACHTAQTILNPLSSLPLVPVYHIHKFPAVHTQSHNTPAHLLIKGLSPCCTPLLSKGEDVKAQDSFSLRAWDTETEPDLISP